MAEDGRLFAARRGPSRKNAGLWELPGGKLEGRETASECLIRELREELGLEVEALDEWVPVHYREQDFHLELIPVACRRTGGVLRLTEHTETGWFDPAGLRALTWSPADIPVVERWLSEAARV
jgi:8-oxo-dGTP diphosphatase